jgi:hypothetical protein
LIGAHGLMETIVGGSKVAIVSLRRASVGWIGAFAGS